MSSTSRSQTIDKKKKPRQGGFLWWKISILLQSIEHSRATVLFFTFTIVQRQIIDFLLLCVCLKIKCHYVLSYMISLLFSIVD